MTREIHMNVRADFRRLPCPQLLIKMMHCLGGRQHAGRLDSAGLHHDQPKRHDDLLRYHDVYAGGVRHVHRQRGSRCVSYLSRYFGFDVLFTCGIPTVTLEGTKADWQRIVKRLERLYDLGDEPSAWANMLYPILRRFVTAFDGKPDTEFWNHVVHRQRVFCVKNVLSGWLTAFCVWTEEGEWRGGALSPRLNMPRPPPTVIGSGERLASQDRAAHNQHEEGSEGANANATISRQSVLTIGQHCRHNLSLTVADIKFLLRKAQRMLCT